MTAISTIGSQIITFFGSIISALFTTGSSAGSWNALLDYFLIGITVSLLFAGIKMIRKLVWGA